MSRFFVQQEEEEGEELPVVREEVVETEKPKKRKKKTGQNDAEQRENAVAEPQIDGKKKKRGGAPSLVVQKAIDERRKKESEARAAANELIIGIAFDLFTANKLAFICCFAEYVKSVKREQKKKEMREKGLHLSHKERQRLERDIETRKLVEQLSKQAPIAASSTVRRNRKPANSKAQIAETKPQIDPSIAAQTEIEAPIKQNTQTESDKPVLVEDWENLLEDEPETAPANAPNTEKLSLATAPPAKPEKKTLAKPENKRLASESLSVNAPSDRFRSPIICIMGHVDTGKTKILDNIRQTNVQSGEAGGITQQIGASFFPFAKLAENVAKLDPKALSVVVDIPGLLVIDTPGHESFSNLRSRGSSLCDFAVVVVDIMHGLQRQTIESLRMLLERQTPFLIALNKIDRIFGWNGTPNASSFTSLNGQTSHVQMLFREKLAPVVEQLAQLDINVQLYWETEDPLEYVPIVPTSALSGEGMPDLLGYIAHYTQSLLAPRIARNREDFKATVLEVKKIEGIGAVIDMILVNGVLSLEDKIVVSGFDGPIVTNVKSLLMPHPLREMRVKHEHVSLRSVEGAAGLRLCAPGLERAIAGSALLLAKRDDDVEAHSRALAADISRVKGIIRTGAEGVGVAASTLGSLEALLVHLRTEKIPVSHVVIGDVTKSDLQKVLSPFLADESRHKKRELLCVLCFEVRLLPDAVRFAEENGITVFRAAIIYHLCEEFQKHVQTVFEQRKAERGRRAVFPCELKIVAAFNKRDPIVIGVDVTRGVLRPGTPLCVPSKGNLLIGVVESIQANHKSLLEARKINGNVAVRLKSEGVTFGRQFDESDELVSVLTRESIDALKEYFRDEMKKDDWDLVRKLKTNFNIL